MRYLRNLSLAAMAALAALPGQAFSRTAVRPFRASAPKSVRHTGTVNIRLLALNDFHGHIEPGTATIDGRKVPVGGAAFLAAMLRRERAAHPNTLVVDAGDMVGASPPVSALFQDEPTVEFLNAVPVDVGTLGNHEFDEGVTELLRLWHGGAHKASRYYPKPFGGAKFPVLCANILDARTGRSILPPYTVKRVGGVRVGFIGAVTADLPNVTTGAALRGVREIDPVAAINRWAAHLKKYGVHAIVVLIHEGGVQKPETPQGTLTGAIVDIAKRVDPDVDVLVSAHSHQYTDAFIGKILVTQARWAGSALAEIGLTVDRGSDDIVRKTGRIVDTVHDGITPAPDVERMVSGYAALAAPRINKVVSTSAIASGRPGHHGESPLGDLIADAQRAATKADIAMMNPGGIRSDIAKGPVTWGQLYAIQPFGNDLIVMKMTGTQIKGVLEQQWGPGEGGEPREMMLQISGLSYTYDPNGPYGHRLKTVNGPDGQPLEDDRTYTVAANAFLAEGGDGFTLFKTITDKRTGPNDLDALIDYVAAHPGIVPPAGRISEG